jgi:hypothetical protein
MVAAPFATPPLPGCDETKPDEAATAALGTVRKSEDHQDAKLSILPSCIKSDISRLNPRLFSFSISIFVHSNENGDQPGSHSYLVIA